MMPIQIIAEAGVNHNGDIGRAKELIAIAADAGADSVKFQTFKSKKLATAGATKADYQKAQTEGGESQLEMLQRLELSREQHVELIECCQHYNIDFLSTPFDHDSIDLLLDLGIRQLKVPSGEVNNIPYLRRIGATGKPVLLSTGMSTLGEVECALGCLRETGPETQDITILHCNTEYPTPMCDVNLSAMLTMEQAFDVAVGYSDHTLGIEVSIAAASLGARVLEKHFTLDRSLPGPDHAASLEPDELKQMVTAVRNIEVALGTGIKRPSPSESRNLNVARKSIVAAEFIARGEQFTEDNLTAKRPGTGLSVSLWDTVIGQVAARDFQPDEQIEWLA